MIHSAIRRPIPSPMLVPAASDATPGRERVDGRPDDARTGAEEDDRRGDHPVVVQRERERNEQDEEAERLLPHAVARPAEREDRHQQGDEHEAAVSETKREPADARLDRLRLHRDGDERADGEHEEEDRRRSVEDAHLPGTDEPVRRFHAVEPVWRCVPELLEAVRERGVDAVDAWVRRDLGTRRGLGVGRRRPGLAR